jgi:hypothetical protein
MAAITRWDALLPVGYQVDHRGLVRDGRPVLRASRRELTELVTGYRGLADLVLAPDCQLEGADSDRAQLVQDFPPSLPKWSLEPYWV